MKKQVNLTINELKSFIKESLTPILEGFYGNYGQSGTATYRPGENAELPMEQIESIEAYGLQPEYSISFNMESSGGDGYNTPDEEYIVPSQDDINVVLSDIEKIQDPNVKQAISNEFGEWLDSVDVDMDYNEPDPDRFRDAMYETLADDPHFNDPNTIAKDKQEAWDELDLNDANQKALMGYGDDRYKDTIQNYTPDFNQNIIGKTMPDGEHRNGCVKTKDGYWFPDIESGEGHIHSMLAQSDNPTDREVGQTSGTTWRQTFHNKGIYEENMFESINPQTDCIAIQTRTGAYEITNVKPLQASDPEMVAFEGMVGQTQINVILTKEDYNNLTNQGISCRARYYNLDMESGWQNCTLSVYNKA